MKMGTVTTASPLAVRLDGASTAIPAKVITRADSYAPAANARVLVELVNGRLYVIGGA